MKTTPEFHNYTGGVFIDRTGNTTITHEISVVGWGVEDGVKYWIARNSWGEYWGEKGMFRLLRGENNLGIESECSFAVPRDTWTHDLRNTTESPMQAKPSNRWWQRFFE